MSPMRCNIEIRNKPWQITRNLFMVWIISISKIEIHTDMFQMNLKVTSHTRVLGQFQWWCIVLDDKPISTNPFQVVVSHWCYLKMIDETWNIQEQRFFLSPWDICGCYQLGYPWCAPKTKILSQPHAIKIMLMSRWTSYSLLVIRPSTSVEFLKCEQFLINIFIAFVSYLYIYFLWTINVYI